MQDEYKRSKQHLTRKGTAFSQTRYKRAHIRRCFIDSFRVWWIERMEGISQYRRSVFTGKSITGHKSRLSRLPGARLEGWPLNGDSMHNIRTSGNIRLTNFCYYSWPNSTIAIEFLWQIGEMVPCPFLCLHAQLPRMCITIYQTELQCSLYVQTAYDASCLWLVFTRCTVRISTRAGINYQDGGLKWFSSVHREIFHKLGHECFLSQSLHFIVHC